MTTPHGDDAVLHELDLEVRAELGLAETTPPAADVPMDQWLLDPEDAERDEIALRSLLGAVEAMEAGDDPEETRS